MPSVRCHYCRVIKSHAPTYRVRSARHEIDSLFPRCDWHWRFDCEVCARARTFHATAFCSREGRFFCIDCAREHRAVRTRFWAWTYFYRLRCPWRSETHAALDRLEHEGKHPWQVQRAAGRSRRGMSQHEGIEDRWSFWTEPMERVTQEVSRDSWDAVASWWTSRYSPRGDVNREYVIDPALFRLLGPVRGQEILDAGCGAGYLARLLAKKGARVVGVDQSRGLLDVARGEEDRDPLGITFLQADLSRLSGLASRRFDLVVSNVVLQDVLRLREAMRELLRVLRPGGRLLFSVTHPCFERPVPGRWVREPPDSERIEEWRGVLLDHYYERVAVWWGPAGKPATVGFHRTLEEYAASLSAAGFLIRRIEEPRPSEAAIERMYRQFADYSRVPNFLIIEAIRPGFGLVPTREVMP